MDPQTREAMKQKALTVWLNAPVSVLLARVKKRDTRPLLRNGDPKETLERLLAVREPFYAQADIVLECKDESHQAPLEQILAALRERELVTMTGAA